MKVLLINGSPRAHGNTYIALREMEKVFQQEGVETELIHIGHLPVRGCIACGKCYETGKCAFDDIVNEVAEKFAEADGLMAGSPVSYATDNATLAALIPRMIYSHRHPQPMKVGASAVVARRGGLSSTYDEINKFYGISGMPIASGQYWNSVHGARPGEAEQDAEGLQGMRTLARNMTFLMKSIALGKEKYGLPEREKGIATNFIR